MSLTFSNPEQEREIRNLAHIREETPEKVLSDLVGKALSGSPSGNRGQAEAKRGPGSFFDPHPTLEALSAAQGVKPISDFNALLGDFWPEDESADAFIGAVWKWREEGGNA